MVKINKEELYEVTAVKKGKKNLLKKLFTGGVAFCLSFSLLSPTALAATPNYPDTYINDEIVTTNTNKTAFVENNGTYYFPLATTLNSYGYKTSYNSKTGEITASMKGKTLVLKDGEKTFMFNGSKYEISSPIRVIDGTTYVPMYVILKSLDATVEINEETSRVNFITDEESVLKDRINTITKAIDNNKNLNYTERQNIKDYITKYIRFMNPNMEDYEEILKYVTSMDVVTRYDGSTKPYYTFDKNTIVLNGSRNSNTYDNLRNALTYRINPTDNVLFKYGMTELLSAELNKDNTKQNLDMVNICKMLIDIVGKNTVLNAYKENDMGIIKDALMSIYDDEALYEDFEELLVRIQTYNEAYSTNQTIKGMSKTEQKARFNDDAAHIYGILDTYYQCKYGCVISKDDVMEGLYNELLCHGSKKAFKVEVRRLNDELNPGYAIIYRTMQNGYNYGSSSYYYYDSVRPTNDKGNGEILELVLR